jgi:hypothetical protein
MVLALARMTLARSGSTLGLRRKARLAVMMLTPQARATASTVKVRTGGARRLAHQEPDEGFRAQAVFGSQFGEAPVIGRT